MRPALALAAALVLAAPARAQADPAAFAVYDAAGAPTTLAAVLDAAARADVVFLGETHDDPTAHALQLEALAGLHARAAGRPLVLALEMFETDVQLALDEYLAGLVSERDFLAAARPWANYAADYRPLVEWAREHGVAVVGTNAPARYVRLVAREGAGALDRLTPEARAFLPPAVVPASDALAARFRALMGEMAGHGGPSAGGPGLDGMLAAQNLRDATMAWRTAEVLREGGNAVGSPLVVHLNGSFHSDRRQGIPEHLTRLAPSARAFVVSMTPAESVAVAPEPDGSDAHVRTDAARLPRR